MNIAVPKSDIERIGSTSIPIPDMEGMYFAGLSVFHELHCIVSLFSTPTALKASTSD